MLCISSGRGMLVIESFAPDFVHVIERMDSFLAIE